LKPGGLKLWVTACISPPRRDGVPREQGVVEEERALHALVHALPVRGVAAQVDPFECKR
jgi:hypothetical protein